MYCICYTGLRNYSSVLAKDHSFGASYIYIYVVIIAFTVLFSFCLRWCIFYLLHSGDVVSVIEYNSKKYFVLVSCLRSLSHHRIDVLYNASRWRYKTLFFNNCKPYMSMKEIWKCQKMPTVLMIRLSYLSDLTCLYLSHVFVCSWLRLLLF